MASGRDARDHGFPAMMGSDGSLPPTQFTKGLTRAEVMLAHQLFRYDATTDTLLWKERGVGMFSQYYKPERTQAGWTRAMARKKWAITVIRGMTPRYPDGYRGHHQWGRVDFTYQSQRYQWHMNDIYRLMTGRSMVEPMALKRMSTRRSSRVDVIRDAWLVRQMIAADRDGVLRWQPVTRDVWDRLVDIRKAYGGFNAAVDANLSHRAYARGRVGKPVTADAEGFVRFGGQVTVSWSKVCEIVGAREIQPAAREPKDTTAPITDAMIRMLVFARYYSDVGEVRYGWKPRSEDMWKLMVMCGVIDKPPTERFKDSWARRFAGRRFGEGRAVGSPEKWGDIAPYGGANRTHDATVKIGKCLVKGRRLEKVMLGHHEGVPDGYTHYCHYPANRGGF